MGIADNKGEFSAFALGADFPAFLREGALEALGVQSDVSRGISSLRRQGFGIPLKVNRVGHYFLGVVAPGEGRPEVQKGPTF